MGNATSAPNGNAPSTPAGAAGGNGAASPGTGDTRLQAATGTGPSAPGAASPTPQAGAPAGTVTAPAEPHWLDRYFWPVVVLSLAFVVAVLAFVFRRRRPPHEAEPVERPLPVDFDLDLNSPPSDEPAKSRPKPPNAP
ncbi:hypothetical protein IMZ29_13880 [Achromobacter sp. GG226]|uniref:hypothetical protein n=1 Tax=Verticiella alkaliphila TaxID=2779529 RepID=UPI001C0C70B8|nr:hypothetical protein [Verticiella sp. GG226]MBU4611581.1 hypothetical protein [Verticiella sp. GG226]